MKAITLRNPPSDLDSRSASAHGQAHEYEKAVIGLLEEHLTQGKIKQPKLYQDLDALRPHTPGSCAGIRTSKKPLNRRTRLLSIRLSWE
jgi:hypothetical protein